MIRLSKFYCVGALALALLMALTMPVLANDAQGNLATIEADDHLLTLVDNDNNVLPMRFVLGGQVFIDDEEFTLWDLQPGDRVAITYDVDEDGTLVATTIECRRN